MVDRLVTVVKGLFEAMDEVAASAYAAEVEKAVFEGFKETKDGKDVAGGRYKSVQVPRKRRQEKLTLQGAVQPLVIIVAQSPSGLAQLYSFWRP